MITMRMHKKGDEMLLAACDKELLGESLSEGKIKLDINPYFYQGEDASDELLLNRLENATIANLVGERTVGLAIDHGVVEEEHVLYIDGVPHAQMVKM